jgi:hypothetical protein
VDPAAAEVDRRAEGQHRIDSDRATAAMTDTRLKAPMSAPP